VRDVNVRGQEKKTRHLTPATGDRESYIADCPRADSLVFSSLVSFLSQLTVSLLFLRNTCACFLVFVIRLTAIAKRNERNKFCRQIRKSADPIRRGDALGNVNTWKQTNTDTTTRDRQQSDRPHTGRALLPNALAGALTAHN
jgi:hypothetical protein